MLTSSMPKISSRDLYFGKILRFGDVTIPFEAGWECTDRILDILVSLKPDRLILVTDHHVEEALAGGLCDRLDEVAPVCRCSSPAGEGMKSLRCIEKFAERALAAGVTRRSVLVTVGGGVPGNLGGFLAATLFRGIRLVHVPTTILAATDSVISLKQAVNSSLGKNQLGAYYAPVFIAVDLAHFLSLPLREVRSGLGEAVKNCLAIRPQSLSRLQDVLRDDPLAPGNIHWLLEDSVTAKLQLMYDDPHEQQAALVLEYGHTIGHALEMVAKERQLEPLPHGEAVVHGMIIAAAVSEQLGLTHTPLAGIHRDLAAQLGISSRLPSYADPASILRVALSDNKRGYLECNSDELAMVLLKELGKPIMSGNLPLAKVDARLLLKVLEDHVTPVECGSAIAGSPHEDLLCPVDVHNEWDQLEEIIVGGAAGARLPRLGRDLLATEFPDFVSREHEFPAGPFADEIIAQTEEELEILCEALRELGITVRRPEKRSTSARVSTPDWESEGLHDYCPRDGLLAIGRTIIETPMVLRSRFLEASAYRSVLTEYSDRGARWISAPKPRLADSLYHPSAAQGQRLGNDEPVFDAANVLRLGMDLLYLVSDSGNDRGAAWLQRTLGEDYRVHACRGLYASTHIDSTIVPLREGLVLLNPARVNANNLPKVLRGWRHVFAPDLIEQEYAGDRPFCSKWIGMNLLMINPHLAIVDDRQPELIRVLKSHAIEVIPLRLTHARSLGGGFHCVTLDVRRRRR